MKGRIPGRNWGVLLLAVLLAVPGCVYTMERLQEQVLVDFCVDFGKLVHNPNGTIYESDTAKWAGIYQAQVDTHPWAAGQPGHRRHSQKRSSRERWYMLRSGGASGLVFG